MEKNILKTEKLSKLYIKFVIPSVISMVIVGMQQAIDGMFIGNFVNSDAMASITILQPYLQIVMGSGFLISIGAVSYIGRSLGAGDVNKAQNIFKTAYVTMSAVAVFFVIVGVFLCQMLCKLLGANIVLIEDSVIYIRTLSFFIPFLLGLDLFGFVDRVIEKPQYYLYATICSVTVNIVLDYMLIKVLRMGIMGAALATGIAYLVAFLIVAILMFKKSSIINVFKGKYDSAIIKVVIANGSSEGLTSATGAVSAFLFNMSFMKFAGEDGVAAFTVINYIGLIGTLVMFGVSDGISSILSYNYGAKEYKRVNHTIKIAKLFNLSFGILLFIVIMFGGRNLVSLFAKGNNELISIASLGSKIYAFNFLFCGYNILKSGYFTAIGDAMSSAIISLARGLIFTMLGIFVLPMVFDINGVWLTIPFAEVMTVLICIVITKIKYNQHI